MDTRTFEQPITALKELRSTNMRSGWLHEGVSVVDSSHLLVATADELKLLIVRKESHNNISIQDSAIKSIPEASGEVKCIAEFKKTGRIFYGDNNGHVNEILFQSKVNHPFKMIFNNDAIRMLRYDKQKPIMSAFLGPLLDPDAHKEIVQLKVDE